MLVAKYCDHLPLHRQAEMDAREDVDLSRSTLADMVRQTVRLMRPLIDALARHAMAGGVGQGSAGDSRWNANGGERVHADDTVVPMLEPGRGRTRIAGLWTYVRDDLGALGGPSP